MEQEIWKDVVGWEQCYQVSNLGNMRSKDRYVKANKQGVKLAKGQPLVLKYDKDGYCVVHLRDTSTNRNKLAKVHRIVAEAFLTKIDGKNHIDHINSIRDDNRVENLRYCTCKENNGFPLARKHNSVAVKESYDKISGLRDLRSRVFSATRKTIPVRVFRNGSVIGQFDSIQKAADNLGIKSGRIHLCLRRGNGLTGGYFFERI